VPAQPEQPHELVLICAPLSCSDLMTPVSVLPQLTWLNEPPSVKILVLPVRP
jgi:hypothetical protein